MWVSLRTPIFIEHFRWLLLQVIFGEGWHRQYLGLLLVIKKYTICFDGQLYEVAVHVDMETFM